MKKTLTSAFAALALTFVAACSAEDDTAETASTTPATSTAATSAQAHTKSWTYDEIRAAVEPLGYSCSNETQMLMCTSDSGDNWQFKLDADGGAAFRKAACDGGIVDADTKILVDGRTLTVFEGNHGQDLDTFAKALDGAGIPGLKVEDYC